jgi:uncharacterized membrane protein
MLLQAVKRNIVDVAIVLALTATELLLYFLGAPEDMFFVVAGFALAIYVITLVKVIAEYVRLRRDERMRRFMVGLAETMMAAFDFSSALNGVLGIMKKKTAPEVPPDGEPLDCDNCPNKDKCDLPFKKQE